jgi:hypothetical protein
MKAASWQSVTPTSFLSRSQTLRWLAGDDASFSKALASCSSSVAIDSRMMQQLRSLTRSQTICLFV